MPFFAGKPSPVVDRLFAQRDPTDKELSEVLPTLAIEDRLEVLIRKYVGGASAFYDGERTSKQADALIARYLIRKIKPWLERTPTHV